MDADQLHRYSLKKNPLVSKIYAQTVQLFKSQTRVVIADDYPVSILVAFITKMLFIKFPKVDELIVWWIALNMYTCKRCLWCDIGKYSTRQMNKVWAFRRTPYSLDECCIVQ